MKNHISEKEVNLHKLKTRHLNRIKTALKTPEEDNYKFTVQMKGRTGKMHKTKDKNQYTKIIDSTTRKLNKKDSITTADLEQILKPAFKEIVLTIHLNKHEDLLPSFKEEIQRLDKKFKELTLEEEIHQYEKTFTQFILTTNLQSTDKKPFITIYDSEKQKIGTWRHGIETKLPKDKYTVESIAGEQKKEKEIELHEPESIHFSYDLEKLAETEEDEENEQEKSLEQKRREKREDKDFVKAGSKSKTETSNKPTKITTKRNQNTVNKTQTSKSNSKIKKGIIIFAAAITAAYILSTIL